MDSANTARRKKRRVCKKRAVSSVKGMGRREKVVKKGWDPSGKQAILEDIRMAISS